MKAARCELLEGVICSEKETNFDLFPVRYAGRHRAPAATPWLHCNYITPEEFPGELCMGEH